MSDTLDTAAARKLPVPAERHHWRVLGGFSDEQLSDRINLDCVIHQMTLSFDRGRNWDTVDAGYATYIIGDPDDSEVTDAMEALQDEMENNHCLDESGLMEAVQELIEETWSSMSLSGRLNMLLDQGSANLSAALRRRTPDEAYAPLESELYESGLI